VVIYLVLAALIYSRLQPEWGRNRATLVALIAFFLATSAVTGLGILLSRTYLHARYRADGHPRVEPFTLMIALLCVVASRLADFLPGYLYGVLAVYVPRRVVLKDSDQGEMHRRHSLVMLAVGVGAWLAFGGVKHFAGGDHPAFAVQVIQGVFIGLFMAGVETLAIGLTPVRPLGGAILRRTHPRWWRILYPCSLFMFVLVLLHPGLAEAHERSAWWTLGLALTFGVISVLFWASFRYGPLSKKRFEPQASASS
jgi:hypothetical protein